MCLIFSSALSLGGVGSCERCTLPVRARQWCCAAPALLGVAVFARTVFFPPPAGLVTWAVEAGCGHGASGCVLLGMGGSVLGWLGTTLRSPREEFAVTREARAFCCNWGERGKEKPQEPPLLPHSTSWAGGGKASP